MLVTGATSGLGRALVLRFADAGADVALVGRSEADLERTAGEVTAHGVRAIPLRSTWRSRAASPTWLTEPSQSSA